MKHRLLLSFLLALSASALLSSCYYPYYGHGRTAAEESRASFGSMSPSKR